MLPALSVEELPESDDPGWELEVMSRRADEELGAGAPGEESAFAAMLRAKRAAAAPRHVPKPPVAHPQFHGLMLEPPPDPVSTDTEGGLLHPGPPVTNEDPDPEQK